MRSRRALIISVSVRQSHTARADELLKPAQDNAPDSHEALAFAHTSVMGEALSLIAALVSAVAGVIASAVAVAQWRESHPRSPDRRAIPPESPRSTSTPQEVPPAAPQEVSPAVPSKARQVRQGSRSLLWALVFGAVCCLLTAVNQFSYWNIQQIDRARGVAGVTATTGILSLLVSIVGIPLALIAAAVAIHRRRGRDFRLALVAFLVCFVPWIGLWIIYFIDY